MVDLALVTLRVVGVHSGLREVGTVHQSAAIDTCQERRQHEAPHFSLLQPERCTAAA